LMCSKFSICHTFCHWDTLLKLNLRSSSSCTVAES